MTDHKKLKARIRARMDSTGEAYTVARRHVLNAAPASDHRLLGGIHPETSAIGAVLANRGITDPTTGLPLSEAMLLGLGGGLGAGYILWEFKESDRRVVTTGFRNMWQYTTHWYEKLAGRIGVPLEILETGSQRRAAEHLEGALGEGLAVVAFVSVADVPYWHMPASESGWWGSVLAVYASTDGGYLIDDRNGAPLTVGAQDLAAARGRITSFKNRLVVPDAASVEVGEGILVAGVEEGLADQVTHLGARSASFSLPAIAKWAKMLTSTTNAKGWPQVFSDGRGLLGALVSSYEAVDEVGILGGSLRPLYADFLDEASRLTDHDLAEPAAAYRVAAGAWADFAAVCIEVPMVADVVDSDRARRSAVRAGDAGVRDAARAARRAQQMLDDDALRLDPAERDELFGAMGGALTAAHQAEVHAWEALRRALE